ncbi:RHS repeat-associated core domain-containing protein [Streptomyces avicenniae]|uniref:RHS repeat-associated core domain-containing protein n=1 Tax=Streptomyces avicenniae TaxID=500153 RepID=UPI00069C0270|nr:DUF6531 domain-containing protein [Streptomyces avicenniae]
MRNLVRSRGTDPIDLATGTMYLPQTDLVLPGTLPLVFNRRAESGYGAGFWFGPSWASTLDQRLEVDEEGVVLVTEDGMLLTYPHQEVGAAALPSAGPSLELRRLADGTHTVTDPVTGHTRCFAKPGNSGVALLTRIIDRNANTIDFTYDAYGAPTALRHSAGYHLTVTTDDGRVTALTLENGGGTVKRYGYTDGSLTEIIDSSGAALRLTYDDRHRITSWTDTNAGTYAYTYDDRDRCTSGRGGAGHLTLTLAYDGQDAAWPGRRVTTVTTAEGRTTRFVVNDHCDVVAEIDPLGHVTRSEFDERHRLTAWTDALGHTTRVTHHETGQPLTVTRPDGETIRMAYDALGQLTEATLPNGAVWQHRYDEHGNRVATTDPLGGTVRRSFDRHGALTSTSTPLGATTRLVCDPAGLPVEVTDPLGARRTRRYDAFGRVTAVEGDGGGLTRLWWSVEGRLTRVVGPDGAERTWEYDGEGNCRRLTGPGGATTTFEHTDFDLLAARTDPDGSRYTFEHDASLRLTKVVDGQGRAWEYTYDAAGRLTAERDFDGRRTAYARDAAGRLVSRTNAAGQTVSYVHDSMGRLIGKDTGDRRITFAHDGNGNLVGATGPDCEVRRTLDAVGRITSESINGRALHTRYDEAGRRSGRLTPSGLDTDYVHDAAGRRTSFHTHGHDIASTYDLAGRELTRTLGESLRFTHDWDTAGRLVEQLVSVGGRELGRRSYAYRPDGVLEALSEPRTGETVLETDRAGRVTSLGEERYTYRSGSMQNSAQWSGRTTDGHAYDGYRLSGTGATHYEYDEAGRVVVRRKKRLSRKPDVWRYRWDAEDRLVEVVTPDGKRWHYAYDPFGRRISKRFLPSDGESPAEQTLFTWDRSVLVEQTTTREDLAHSITLTWEYDGRIPLSQTERLTDRTTQEEVDSRFFAIVTDLTGSPRELISETGETGWRADRTLWGVTSWARGSTAHTPLRFPGQYADPESGLAYNYQRHYDDETARYVSPDPLGLAAGPDPYAYVGNPFLWTDPLGLSPCPNNVALGLRSEGLREFAEAHDFTHYLDDMETWENQVWQATRNEDVRLHVALDGFTGSTPSERFMNAYREGMGDNWFATEREMYHVGESVRREYRSWDSITFYEGGSPVSLPEPATWPRPGRT